MKLLAQILHFCQNSYVRLTDDLSRHQFLRYLYTFLFTRDAFENVLLKSFSVTY